MTGTGAKQKLSDIQRDEIIELLMQGNYTHKSISVMYGVSMRSIARIAKDEEIRARQDNTEMPDWWVDDWDTITRKIKTYIVRAKNRKVTRMLEGRR